MSMMNGNGRVEFHSTESERIVLSAMLRDGAVLARISKLLSPLDCYDPAHQKLFRLFLEEQAAARPIDPTSIFDAARRAGWLEDIGGAVYLAELADEGTSIASAEHHAGIVREYSGRRELLRLVEELSHDARRPDLSTAALQEMARNRFADVGPVRAATKIEPIPASALRAAEAAAAWLWTGFLQRGSTTLLSALWKAGKTTLLLHMLRAMGAGGSFLGKDIQPCRVLYVSEESEARWARRRDEHGLGDHVEFVLRPFRTKPRPERWESFLREISDLVKERGYDVVVFDTIASLWPVRDENDASAVQ